MPGVDEQTPESPHDQLPYQEYGDNLSQMTQFIFTAYLWIFNKSVAYCQDMCAEAIDIGDICAAVQHPVRPRYM